MGVRADTAKAAMAFSEVWLRQCDCDFYGNPKYSSKNKMIKQTVAVHEYDSARVRLETTEGNLSDNTSDNEKVSGSA